MLSKSIIFEYDILNYYYYYINKKCIWLQRINQIKTKLPCEPSLMFEQQYFLKFNFDLFILYISFFLLFAFILFYVILLFLLQFLCHLTIYYILYSLTILLFFLWNYYTCTLYTWREKVSTNNNNIIIR